MMDAKIATRTNYTAFGQRQSVSGSASIVCRYWKAGNCTRVPCRFLHSDLPSAPNSVHSRIAFHKQSSTSVEEGPRRRKFHYSLKRSFPSTDVCGSQNTQKPSNIVSKRKTLSVSSTEVAVPIEKRIRLPPKVHNISKPAIEVSFRNHPGTKTSLVSSTQIGVPEEKKTSSVLATVSDDHADRKVSPVPTEGDKAIKAGTEKPCMDWMSSNCMKGNDCQLLHKWNSGDWFSMLVQLGKHKQAVSGITLPPRCDKLFSSCKDGTVYVWDCQTGELANMVSLGEEVGSLISEGPWTFVGMPNLIKAWNLETQTEMSLDGYVSCGQIYAMAVAEETLFAGAEDGSILVWRGSKENSMPFHFTTSLKGHTGAVKCLIVGNGEKRLCSGSTDGSIRGAVALCGLYDAEEKPVLCCSCNDNSVYLYDLPSFCSRGRIFSLDKVRTISMGPEGLFFTGDEAGLVRIWKLTKSRNSSPKEAQ